MVSIANAYANTKRVLVEAGIEDANFDAAQLILHITGKTRFDEHVLSAAQAQKLFELAKKRAKHEPLQYLLGTWGFMGLELAVGEGVLIPRPETEEVCCEAINELLGKETPEVLDLCAGTGALALGIQSKVSGANIRAVEFSEKAFEYLRINIQKFKKVWQKTPCPIMLDALQFHKQIDDNSLDLIVCNPPYVTQKEYEALAPELFYEPKQALVAKKNGLIFYEEISQKYFLKIKKGGALIFEIGASQKKDVEALVLKAGFSHVIAKKDMAGNARIIIAKVL